MDIQLKPIISEKGKSDENQHIHFAEDTIDANRDGSLSSLDKPVDKHHKRFRRRLSSHLLYSVNDNPSWPTSFLLAFQQIVVCASGLISTPLVVADLLCAKDHPMARVTLMGTTMIVCGVSTFMQSTFGIRLPLLQGPSYAFLPPMIAMMKIPEFQCPSFDNIVNKTDAMTFNESDHEFEFVENVFRSRMQVIQGTFVAAGAFEAFIGMTGLIGLITKFVGPLTVVPLMLCLELSAAQFTVEYASKHWISAVVTASLLITALYLQKVSVPVPAYDSKRKWYWKKFPVFSVFTYLIVIMLVWFVCLVLTKTNVFDNEHHNDARTDLRTDVIYKAPWFRMPYPGQWGPVGFNFGVFLGMIAATLASVTESVGDYYACARACRQPEPPSHAVNRGILIEGLSCFFGGFMGGSSSVTTYSEAVGAIGITKVASRRAMQLAGFIFVFLGVFTKFGAILATIPDPIIGGILTLSCAMIGGVGMSSLKSVDLRCSRNVAILGFAFFMGILIPAAVTKNPFNTGIHSVDQVLNILFSIQMFVAGLTGFLLDNTVPWATREQRGLSEKSSDDDRCQLHYDLPIAENIYFFHPRTMLLLRKIPFVKFIPFLPPVMTQEDDEEEHVSEEVEDSNEQ